MVCTATLHLSIHAAGMNAWIGGRRTIVRLAIVATLCFCDSVAPEKGSSLTEDSLYGLVLGANRNRWEDTSALVDRILYTRSNSCGCCSLL